MSGGPRTVGRFRLLEERGRDEVGTVWSAEDGTTGEALDLRLLPAGLARNNLVHVRFLRDAARAAAIDHPSLVRVREGGEAGGELWLATDRAEGRTLADLIEEARGGKPEGGVAPLPGEETDPFRRAAAFFERLSEVLQAVHDGGLVHGRLEPRRVLIDADGAPRVKDLGLPGAGLLGELSLDRAPVRATSWSAPESLDPTELLEPRADVFSLGALLYQVLTLRPPWDEATTEGLAWRLRTTDPVPVRRWNPGVPKDLERVVRNALARDRGPRYHGAADLAADLRRFLDGKRVPLRKEPLPGRLLRWPVRHPVMVSMMLLGAVLGEAALFLWLHAGRVEPLVNEVETLRARTAQDRRQLDVLARNEGWAQMARALEPILDASLDVESADPDLAVLLARTALERSEGPQWTGLLDAREFRRRATDRLREALRNNRLLARVPTTGGAATQLVAAGDGSGRFAVGSADGKVRFLEADGRCLAEGRAGAGRVRGLRAQAGGRLFASACGDGAARVWGTDGSEVAVFAGHAAPVNAAAVDGEERRLLTASEDGTAILWGMNGERVAVLRGDGGAVLDAAFDDERGFLLTASADGTARVWKGDGRIHAILGGHGGAVTRVLPFDLGGSAWLTLSSDGTARTWSAEGKPLLVLPHGGAPTCFASDGRGRLLTGAEDGVARLFDGEGRLVASLAIPGARVTAVDGSGATGLLLAAGSDGILRLWRDNGVEVDRFSGDGGAAAGAALDAAGERVSGAFADGTVRTWTRESGEVGYYRGTPGRILLGSEDWRSGHVEMEWVGGPRRFVHALFPAVPGSAEGGSPGSARFIRWPAGGSGETLDIPLQPGAAFGSIAVGGGLDRTAVGGEDGVLRLFDGNGNPAGIRGVAGGPPVTAIDFDSGGGVLAGCADGSVLQWETDGSVAMAGFKVPPVTGPVRFLVREERSSNLLLLGTAREIQLVSMGTRPRIVRIESPGPLAGVALSRTSGPGPPNVLIALTEDGRYSVFDERGVKVTGRIWLRLPEGNVRAVAGRGDGSFLVLTDGGDGRCRVWSITREGSHIERVAVLEGHGEVVSAVLGPGLGVGGRARAVTACSDGTLRCFALSCEELLEISRARVPRTFTEEEYRLYPGLSLRSGPPPRARGNRR